jgi:uncharacterized protein (TIGR02246 family)
MKFAIGLLTAALLFSGAGMAGDTAEKTFTDIEQAWGNAMSKKDVAYLTALLADDWSSISSDGKREGKSELLEIVKSGKLKITSFKVHDVKVRLLGDKYAVVQGYDDETSTYEGKDESGSYVWTDVFEKRGGKWVALNSQASKVKK